MSEYQGHNGLNCHVDISRFIQFNRFYIKLKAE